MANHIDIRLTKQQSTTLWWLLERELDRAFGESAKSKRHFLQIQNRIAKAYGWNCRKRDK